MGGSITKKSCFSLKCQALFWGPAKNYSIFYEEILDSSYILPGHSSVNLE